MTLRWCGMAPGKVRDGRGLVLYANNVPDHAMTRASEENINDKNPLRTTNCQWVQDEARTFFMLNQASCSRGLIP
jgi:hypothetical protein